MTNTNLVRRLKRRPSIGKQYKYFPTMLTKHSNLSSGCKVEVIEIINNKLVNVRRYGSDEIETILISDLAWNF